MKGLSIFACIAVIGGSSSAAAQEPAPPAQPPRPPVAAPRSVAPGETCTTVEPGRIECRRVEIERGVIDRVDSAMMKRAALGLQLAPTGTARDTLGVFVAAVTPKGPAENAGIFEGDRIVSINGVDLRVARGDVEDSYASGLPSHRLQREVAKLTPGSRVNLRVYSGGRIRDVQVVAARASDLMRSRMSIGGFAPGAGGFIYRDGMAPMGPMTPMPAMPPMSRMAPMMDDMRVWQIMPRMEQMREIMPQMRRMELRMPRMRLNAERARLLGPEGVYRLRTPGAVRRVSPQRAKVEAEQKAKAKADSVKKLK